MEYSEQTKENFLNPKNMGDIENADGTGEVGSPACGDIMKIDIKIEDNIIVDIKFKSFLLSTFREAPFFHSLFNSLSSIKD